MYPVVSDDPKIQGEYEAMRRAGQAHGMAQILALRRPPGSKTNRELLRGVGTLADQFKGEESVLEKVVANARAYGYEPHYTDLYQPSLVPFGESPGHPDAFIPPSEGASHVHRVMERRGESCHGLVEHKSPDRDPAPAAPRLHHNSLPPLTPAESKYPLQPIKP